MRKQKIVILGAAEVGKTSLVNALLDKRVQESYLMTVGFETETYRTSFEGAQVDFSLFDTAGQKELQISKQVFYVGLRGALLVFDLTRKHTLYRLEDWINELREYAPPDLPLILVGTKSDLKDMRAVSNSEIEEFKDTWNILASFKTSAITGENIKEIFNLIITWLQ